MTLAAPTLTERIGAAILARIEARSLAPGARLPSIRGAAAEFSVSKSTIVEAYDRLVAAGHIQARRGSGFTVTARRAASSLQELAPKLDRAIDPVWVARQSLETEERALRPGCGWLPESWLPEADLRRALRGVAQAPHAKLLEYGHPLGYLPLRQALQARLAELEIDAPPTRILLTDGGTQAIDLTLRHLIQPGDAVLVDDPGYFNFHANLRAHRAISLPVPRRPDGPDLELLAALAQAHKPRLYLMNAAPHNPTGGALSPAIAHRLLQLAETHDFHIVEDDVFADFRRHPTPILAALDGLKRVIHLGSFSKTLSAGVRCGFIAADEATIDALLDLKIATCFGSDLAAAQMVHRLIADGPSASMPNASAAGSRLRWARWGPGCNPSASPIGRNRAKACSCGCVCPMDAMRRNWRGARCGTISCWRPATSSARRNPGPTTCVSMRRRASISGCSTS